MLILTPILPTSRPAPVANGSAHVAALLASGRWKATRTSPILRSRASLCASDESSSSWRARSPDVGGRARGAVHLDRELMGEHNVTSTGKEELRQFMRAPARGRACPRAHDPRGSHRVEVRRIGAEQEMFSSTSPSSPRRWRRSSWRRSGGRNTPWSSRFNFEGESRAEGFSRRCAPDEWSASSTRLLGSARAAAEKLGARDPPVRHPADALPPRRSDAREHGAARAHILNKAMRELRGGDFTRSSRVWTSCRSSTRT